MKSIATKLLPFLVLPCMLLLSACGKDDDNNPVDPGGDGPEIPAAYENLPGTILAEDVTWANDTTITGPHFVLPGITLTIEEGVTVTFTYHNNNNENVGSIITLPADASNFEESRPSGRLMAVGTESDPIIFTSENGQINDWGGIILAGAASNNIPGGLGEIEGLEEGVQYGADIDGGEDFIDDDDSGRLSYVQIKYSGYSISDGSELQALTLYSVGSGTQLDHISIYGSSDDGVELFGGTVDIKYLVVVGAQDDSFDYDQGWTGRGQFWLGVQNNPSNRGFENDGCNDIADCDGGNGPTSPQIYNVTVWGNDTNNGEDIRGIYLREGMEGSYNNIIVANFQKAPGIPIEVHTDTEANVGTTLTFEANYSWNNLATGDTLSYYSDLDLTELGADPFTDAANFDFTLTGGSDPLTGGATPPNDGFFDDVDFSGAMGSTNWAAGWAVFEE